MKRFQVKLLYIYKFMDGCLPIYAFYTILFIKRGMSVTDIAVLMALWSLFTIVFEVPSGILADRWNRRNMLAIAAALKGLCFLVWFFSHTFVLFAFGFMFWAVSGAFVSGTEEGLIYDNLKHDGDEKRFAKIYGRARFYTNAGTAAGILSAGVLVGFVSIECIALLSAGICFLNVLFALRIREKNYYAEGLSRQYTSFFTTLKEAGSFIKGNKTVLITTLFLMLFVGLGGYLDEFDALIIHDFGLGNHWVSVFMAVRFGLIALGDIVAPMVQRKLSSLRSLFLLSGLAFVFLLVFAVFWHPYAVLLFGLAFMVMAVAEILLVHALQREIREEGRATVMSFYGIGQNAAMICFSLIYALLAGLLTLQHVYMILSVYGIAGALGFCLLLKLGKGKA